MSGEGGFFSARAQTYWGAAEPGPGGFVGFLGSQRSECCLQVFWPVRTVCPLRKHMEIHLVSSLTPDDENRLAPTVLKALGDVLERLPVSYSVRIETAIGTAIHHNHTAAQNVPDRSRRGRTHPTPSLSSRRGPQPQPESTRHNPGPPSRWPFTCTAILSSWRLEGACRSQRERTSLRDSAAPLPPVPGPPVLAAARTPLAEVPR